MARSHAASRSEDLAASAADQTASDTDQTLSDPDQAQAEADQRASDRDQAASDRDLGASPEAHDALMGRANPELREAERPRPSRAEERDNEPGVA